MVTNCCVAGMSRDPMISFFEVKVHIFPGQYDLVENGQFRCQLYISMGSNIQFIHVTFMKWLRTGDVPVFEQKSTPDEDLVSTYSVAMNTGRLTAKDVGTYFCNAVVKYSDGREVTGSSELAHITYMGASKQ